MSETQDFDRIAWSSVAADIDAHGWADLGPLISDSDADALKALYPEPSAFRSHVIMRRHGFGEGEYKYFAHPLPRIVQQLRTALYPGLAGIANRWSERLGSEMGFPPTLDGMLDRCHGAGQVRPTPLLLKYRAGDYNRLHQDLYGAHVFPLQVVILLSDPGDFDGGELVLTEQRPRMQSRAEVVPLEKGRGVVFAVNDRPVEGSRGVYRAKQRHGVSRVRAGERYTLGIIFHDAA